jgi:hypothetical protein
MGPPVCNCLQKNDHERLNWLRGTALFRILTIVASLFQWSSVLYKKLDVEKPGCLKVNCGPQV